MERNIARVLLNTNDEDKKAIKNRPPQSKFDLATMIDMFPGPALLVDGAMAVSYQNLFAKGLLVSLEEKQTFLTSMITRCLSNNCPDTQKVTLEDTSGLRHYDLYAFPLMPEQNNGNPLVYLFGRETTIEHNLTNALVDSRQMFKDLVGCSADFAWETDNNGDFIYVSPKGILGFTAFELNGRNSHDMIIGADELNPFSTTDRVETMELWLNRADGAMACLLVSAVPVLNGLGKWKGTRGVCRDITHMREKEAVLRRIQKREHTLNNIISSIRGMVNPADMLENSLSAIMDGIKADTSLILQKSNSVEGSNTAAVKQQMGEVVSADLIFTLGQMTVDLWQNTTSTSPETQTSTPKVSDKIKTFTLGKHQIQMGITRHHGRDNGAIILIREQHMPWQDDEIQLFTGITNHLAIAIEQVITHEELERRASTDELTNMLNRRAFRAAIKPRIDHQKRSHREGALMYIDLDNFKNVNDTKGHAQGDKLLKELSRIINSNIRVGDFSARLGGDEFAVWLDETSEKDALTKARHFVAAGTQLARLADVTGPQPSLSIGVAIKMPENEQTLDEIMEQADEALYHAKENGKATYALYGALKKPAQGKSADQTKISPLDQEGDNNA